jgi:hypothetical protein
MPSPAETSSHSCATISPTTSQHAVEPQRIPCPISSAQCQRQNKIDFRNTKVWNVGMFHTLNYLPFKEFGFALPSTLAPRLSVVWSTI